MKLSNKILSFILALLIVATSATSCDILTDPSDSVSVTQNGVVEDIPSSELPTDTTDEAITSTTTLNTEETTPDTDDGTLEAVPRDEILEAVGSPSSYQPAASYEEALERTKNAELSGYPYVPDQSPNISQYRPQINGKFIKSKI